MCFLFSSLTTRESGPKHQALIDLPRSGLSLLPNPIQPLQWWWWSFHCSCCYIQSCSGKKPHSSSKEIYQCTYPLTPSLRTVSNTICEQHLILVIFPENNPVWLISLWLSFPTVKSNEILGVSSFLMSQNIKYLIINVFWKNKLIHSNGSWSSNSQSEKKLFSGTGRKTIHYQTTGPGLLQKSV